MKLNTRFAMWAGEGENVLVDLEIAGVIKNKNSGEFSGEMSLGCVFICAKYVVESGFGVMVIPIDCQKPEDSAYDAVVYIDSKKGKFRQR